MTDTFPITASRIEHDLLGDFEIPAGAYYGVHAARAAGNFCSGTGNEKPDWFRTINIAGERLTRPRTTQRRLHRGNGSPTRVSCA